jgi:UDP-3-O-[3-hydroxymyristoyl] N-acetylglucosamine deacetylase/3-hydroxyacyl-[acyl-carrier-protein] dehydratase
MPDVCVPARAGSFYRQNLIKGGDLTNAIVIVDREVQDGELDHLSQLLNKPKVSVNKSRGVLNNVDLHYPNEMARHKLLDLIGDLALIGRPIKAQILAARPGPRSECCPGQKNQKTDQIGQRRHSAIRS